MKKGVQFYENRFINKVKIKVKIKCYIQNVLYLVQMNHKPRQRIVS